MYIFTFVACVLILLQCLDKTFFFTRLGILCYQFSRRKCFIVFPIHASIHIHVLLSTIIYWVEEMCIHVGKRNHNREFIRIASWRNDFLFRSMISFICNHVSRAAYITYLILSIDMYTSRAICSPRESWFPRTHNCCRVMQ